MNKLFVGKMKGKYLDGLGRQSERISKDIDWTAKVVCARCNNTWMSDIETKHGEPVLTPFIKGEETLSIGTAEAASLAIWTFKTAVVLDHAYKRSREPFFSERIRFAFREHLIIPSLTRMWMTGFLSHRNKIVTQTVYHEGNLTPSQPLNMYVFTCAFGCLTIQLLHVKVFGEANFRPRADVDNAMVPFWPQMLQNLRWPFPVNLSSEEQFSALANRWQHISTYD